MLGREGERAAPGTSAAAASMAPMHTNAATPRIARAAVRHRASVALAVLACAALVSACGSSSNTTSGSTKAKLNIARIQLSIEQSILSERHIHATVVCPAVVAEEVRQDVRMRGHDPRRQASRHAVTKTPFVVTVQNTKGYVTYVGK